MTVGARIARPLGRGAKAPTPNASQSLPLQDSPPGEAFGAAEQTAFRSHRTLRERSLTRPGRAMRAPTTESQPRCARRQRSNNAPRRAADSRPYGENGEIGQKAAVCSCCPVFRGSSCGLREKSCSRNGPPILLARAKPGRGREYGTGWPGGAQRIGQCRSLGCTPRGPMGVRGPQPPARFGNFSAVKSSPPEANKACRVCALPSNRPACGEFGPM